jgi:hypothetical protein
MNRALRRVGEAAYEERPATVWTYVMLSREQSRLILDRILQSRKPLTTLAVWEAVRSYAEWNTGKIPVHVDALAEAARTSPTEVYRALSYLVELGALIRTARGRYSLNPAVAWSGSLVRREEALEPAD